MHTCSCGVAHHYGDSISPSIGWTIGTYTCNSRPTYCYVHVVLVVDVQYVIAYVHLGNTSRMSMYTTTDTENDFVAEVNII